MPEEYGGPGLSVTEASIIMEEINRSGGNAGACHAQMYTRGTLLRHGSDTTQLRTAAVRKGDKYIRPIRTMMNHATTELFIENLEVPAENSSSCPMWPSMSWGSQDRTDWKA
ncbi:acyl-CoA dehydrogenase family protein [Brevibacillus choshinensis]|uniref:acyl-CoA dehydrogenase family protein n=1 Tax=Brevibacillus choshinensis TaxID=54911 RepID=UPI001EEEA52B|nr:acyl-CoA dehydrogenase family protein [Brevibacillus choshinensis]